LEFILKISFSFSNCTWPFSNYALFLIYIVTVPYKKGLLPHVCTVTCKAIFQNNTLKPDFFLYLCKAEYFFAANAVTDYLISFPSKS
jgi:hypothetical protein